MTTNGASITGVQFYEGSTLLGTDTTAPYTHTWSSVAAGAYNLSAHVLYGSGSAVTSSIVAVTVTNLPAGITLTAPANGSSYLAPAAISLAAAVTTNGNTIRQVQFYSGSTLLGTVATAPYIYTWNNVAAGSYNLSAQVDYNSASTAASAVVNVIVTNAAPVIVLSTPTNGATYAAPATIALDASVTANGHTITQVSFYNGTTLLGAATSAPYTYTWSGVAAGAYSLSAKLAYDSGSTLSSASSGVTVFIAPSISSISNRVAAAIGAMPPILFTVSDSQTSASNLTVSASSSNPALVSTTNIVFGGSGEARTLTITPTAGQTGSTEITVTVSYGIATASTTFELTVEPADTAPAAPTLLRASSETGG